MVSRAGQIDAEAAAWVARLHGARTGSAGAALHAWLAEDPAHGDAFERATEVWMMLPGAAAFRDAEPRAERPAQRRTFAPVRALAASVLLLLTCGILWWSLAAADGYATERGEQRVATLEDGSRIALNTDTRVALHFAEDRREVELEQGEAMFEVAHDAARPFIVQAGDTRVRAIGTVFLVRRTADGAIVTLVSGKVAVSDIGARANRAGAVLKPGERLTASAGGSSLIEPHPVEMATAWRRGQAVFRDTSLVAAVAELNRYGGPLLVIDDPRVAALPVSGVFATNDSAEFAESIATLHGLHVVKRGEAVHIVR